MLSSNAKLQAASLRELENQVGQIVNLLKSRSQGAFPSDTKNARMQGKEHCKVISLKGKNQLFVDEIYDNEFTMIEEEESVDLEVEAKKEVEDILLETEEEAIKEEVEPKKEQKIGFVN